jgi:hypothetical protein
VVFNPKQHPPGEWFKVIKTDYKVECCDCSLVHSLSIRQDANAPGEFELKVERDEELTAAQRKLKIVGLRMHEKVS